MYGYLSQSVPVLRTPSDSEAPLWPQTGCPDSLAAHRPDYRLLSNPSAYQRRELAFRLHSCPGWLSARYQGPKTQILGAMCRGGGFLPDSFSLTLNFWERMYLSPYSVAWRMHPQTWGINPL